jgi:DNA polymerase IV
MAGTAELARKHALAEPAPLVERRLELLAPGGPAERVICLADLDCFFVEVERLHRPELRGMPVVIGGRPGERGVVAACSYEARALGVRSALPMSEAYRRVLAAGERPVESGGRVFFLHDGLHGNYQLYSRRVQDVLRDSAPVFHPRSIDEFQLDITGCSRLFARDYGGILGFAEHVRRRVREEVGLKLSIGIGPNRLVAKMASRHAKPDGVKRVLPEEVRAFLGPHDIQAVPGIGPATSQALRELGINTVAELLEQPAGLLRRVCGLGLASLAAALRDGVDGPGAEEEPAFVHSTPAGRPREAVEDGTGYHNPAIGFGHQRSNQPKSIGHETTFTRDVADPQVVERALWRLTEDACRRLREAGLRARHVTVKIRYSDFGTQTHGGFFAEPTDVDGDVFREVLRLFAQGNTRRLRIRLLGVRLERFSAGASQLGLFEAPRARRERELIGAIDRIRAKHGRDSLLAGPGVARARAAQAS